MQVSVDVTNTGGEIVCVTVPTIDTENVCKPLLLKYGVCAMLPVNVPVGVSVNSKLVVCVGDIDAVIVEDNDAVDACDKLVA